MGLKDRLRRAERDAHADIIEVLQLDGSAKRFSHNAPLEALVRCWERGQHYEDGKLGQDAPPPHPFTEALLNAPEDAVNALLAVEGWGFGYIITEERVFRGLEERPGPEVTWSEDGTTCR